MNFFETVSSLHAAALDSIEFTPTMFVLIAVLVLLFVLVGIALRNVVVMRQITFPVYDYTVKKAEEEARRIVHDAEARAQAIRSKAEEDAVSLLKQREADANTLVAKYEGQFKELAEHTGKLMERYSTLAHDTYREFDATVKKSSQSGEAAVKQEIDRLLKELREGQAQLREKVAGEFKDQIAQELDTVERDVAAYREAQLRLIDERIVALVERAAALALQKELSVEQHTDVVFQSLEEAKKEGVI